MKFTSGKGIFSFDFEIPNHLLGVSESIRQFLIESPDAETIIVPFNVSIPDVENLYTLLENLTNHKGEYETYKNLFEFYWSEFAIWLELDIPPISEVVYEILKDFIYKNDSRGMYDFVHRNPYRSNIHELLSYRKLDLFKVCVSKMSNLTRICMYEFDISWIEVHMVWTQFIESSEDMLGPIKWMYKFIMDPADYYKYVGEYKIYNSILEEGYYKAIGKGDERILEFFDSLDIDHYYNSVGYDTLFREAISRKQSKSIHWLMMKNPSKVDEYMRILGEIGFELE
jgi:hypothetical protein